MRHRDFTQGPLLAPLSGYGLLLFLGLATHALFNLVDLVLVARLGQGAVAAVHVGGTVNVIPMIFGHGLGVSAVAMISTAFGRGEAVMAREIANRSLGLLLVLAVATTGLGLLLARDLVLWQGASGEVAETGTEYLLILSGGTVTMLLLMHVGSLLRATGRAGWPVGLIVGSNLLNLGLDLVLIFGWPDAGIPAMGVAGAAWATVLARGAGAVVGLLLLSRPGHPLRLGYAPPFAAGEQVRRLVGIGLPNALQMLVRAIVVIGLTGMVGSLGGGAALDAFGVCTRLDTVLLFGTTGLGAAATLAVGQCLGAGDDRRALKAARASTVLGVLTAAVVVAGLGLLATPLLEAMLPAIGDPRSYQTYLEVGGGYLRIAVWAHPFSAVALVVTGALNGAGVAVPPLVLDAWLFGLILLPVALLAAAWATADEFPVLWVIVVAAHGLLAIGYAALLEGGGWRARRALERMS